MNTEFIARYLSGGCTEKETQELLVWLESSDENKQQFADLKNAWAIANMAGIEADEQVPTQYFEKQRRQFDQINRSKSLAPSNTIKRMYGFKRVAAIIILTMGLTTLINYILWHWPKPQQAYHQLVVPSGQQAQLTLPDGSTIWLNSKSKLLYPGTFSNKKREVILEGEGYFQVKHQENRPFIVKTASLNVKVLGTSFNVAAYNDDKDVKLTLVNGSISILDKANDKELAKLKPNEQAIYSKSHKKLTIETVDIEFYTSWKEGRFKFRRMSFEEIAKRLSRNFNMEFIFKNSEMKNATYTGSFYNYEPVNRILQIMQKSSPFEFEIKNNQVFIK